MTTFEIIFFVVIFLWLFRLSGKSRSDNTIGSVVAHLEERVEQIEDKVDEFIGNGD